MSFKLKKRVLSFRCIFSGGPQIRFSVGADDRQALQPPMSSSLPVTRSSVALLFDQLGMSFRYLSLSSTLCFSLLTSVPLKCSRSHLL